MRALSERDAAAVADVAAELVALPDALPFPQHLVERLRALVRADAGTYNDLDRSAERTLFLVWSTADGDTGAEIPADEGLEGSAYWQYRSEMPVARYRERTNDWTHAWRMSDFATDRDWRRTNIWNLVYRETGANHWLTVGLRSDGRRTRNFVFTAERRDFDERDRLVLDILQPHLQRRWQRTEDASVAAAALAEADWDDPRHVVVCSPGGAIEFGTPAARRLLEAFGAEHGRVPEGLLRTTTTRIRDGRRLTAAPVHAGGLTLLLLGDVDVRLERLTPRQRTILAQAATGATNRQVGKRLGIASDTVRKHLEQIYERLGVHNRVEAAAVLRQAGDTGRTTN